MNKKTFGLYLLCACCSITFFFLLWNWSGLMGLLAQLMKVLRPILVGGAIAFVLNIPLVRIQRLYGKNQTLAQRPVLLNALSVVSVYLLLFAVITGIVLFIVPQLMESVDLFAANFDGYYNNMMAMVDRLSALVNPDLLQEFNWMDKLESLYKELPQLLELALGGAVGVLSSFVGGVMDTFLGLLISIYLLVDKRRMAAQGKALIHAVLPARFASKTLEMLGLIHRTFSAFIGGQCTEAVILGVLCFIGMNLFGFAYAPLISVIIAFTNLIPIVGPIFGTIPCAIILLLVDPIKALWFVVFIIVLQQLESNLIYPRVVGTSVGLPAFWVLVSVIVGGGLFGIPGMLFGIPTVSIIYHLLQNLSVPNATTGNDDEAPPSA